MEMDSKEAELTETKKEFKMEEEKTESPSLKETRYFLHLSVSGLITSSRDLRDTQIH